MQAIQSILLLLAVVTLSAAAPAAPAASAADADDYNYDYSYDSYEPAHTFRLPSGMFSDLKPRPVKRDSQEQSPCSWAVVQCCGVPDRMGSRASCFSRLGCSGAWFSDICTPTIQRSVLQSILRSQNTGL